MYLITVLSRSLWWVALNIFSALICCFRLRYTFVADWVYEINHFSYSHQTHLLFCLLSAGWTLWPDLLIVLQMYKTFAMDSLLRPFLFSPSVDFIMLIFNCEVSCVIHEVLLWILKNVVSIRRAFLFWNHNYLTSFRGADFDSNRLLQ